jgi:hypothetical protein
MKRNNQILGFGGSSDLTEDFERGIDVGFMDAETGSESDERKEDEEGGILSVFFSEEGGAVEDGGDVVSESGL